MMVFKTQPWKTKFSISDKVLPYPNDLKIAGR
jgi:hypothetical protein